VRKDDLFTLLFDPAESNMAAEKSQIEAEIIKLKKDHFISDLMAQDPHKNATLAEGEKNPACKWVYINYEHCINSVRYRLHKIENSLMTNASTENGAFICATCQHTYSDLDVTDLYDMSSGGLKCERGACTGDVVENDKEVDESAAKETEEKGQFIQQTKRLTGLLNDVANLSADAIHPLHLRPEPLKVYPLELRHEFMTGEKNNDLLDDPTGAGASGYGDEAVHVTTVTIGDSQDSRQKLPDKIDFHDDEQIEISGATTAATEQAPKRHRSESVSANNEQVKSMMDALVNATGPAVVPTETDQAAVERADIGFMQVYVQGATKDMEEVMKDDELKSQMSAAELNEYKTKLPKYQAYLDASDDDDDDSD